LATDQNTRGRKTLRALKSSFIDRKGREIIIISSSAKKFVS
jgi:hypothetical protein